MGSSTISDSEIDRTQEQELQQNNEATGEVESSTEGESEDVGAGTGTRNEANAKENSELHGKDKTEEAEQRSQEQNQARDEGSIETEDTQESQKRENSVSAKDGESELQAETQGAKQGIKSAEEVVANSANKCEEDLVGSMQTRTIEDAAITASSYFDGRGIGEMWRTRMDNEGVAWSAGHPLVAGEMWVEWDFGQPKTLTAVLTKGRGDGLQQWITGYKLQLYDGHSWKWYEDDWDGEELSGNSDTISVEFHNLPKLVATKARIYPTKWHQWCSLRATFLGCDKALES